MLNNKNCPRRSINIRNIDDATLKMDLNTFTGMDNKSCIEDMDDMPIAMAYVPWQQWRNLYDPKEALKRGTIFKELDLPFCCAKECI